MHMVRVIHLHVHNVLLLLFLFNFSPSGQGILCGHADGTIVRYTFDNDSELSKVE